MNDRFAATGSFERGVVQSLTGEQADRNALSLGLGYVDKDRETGLEKLKASSKIELRSDSGSQDKNQYLVYNSVEGRLTPNASVYVKTELSKATNTTTDSVEAKYKQIVIGGAYRPLSLDKLNLLARYTYLTGRSPSGQVDNASLGEQRAHILSGEAIYDLTDHWQISEKIAYRKGEEQVEGFPFTQTQTWLMVHRLNYNIDRNWQVSGEYRRLTQVEAQDSRQGFLIEAARKINDFTQLGAGYNFTSFSDDLTDLSFTAQGPFLRLTAKLYDRTPEEIERAQQRILDEKIFSWAWQMVNDELARPDSPIVAQLNDFFEMAQSAHDLKKYELSQQIYKDSIVTGQLMFEEVSNFIRTRIAFEEKLQKDYDRAMEFYRQGEYEKSRKILEKILDDAQKAMLQ